MSKISIIIPVLNEADTISQLLEYLVENTSKKHVTEIIVVDGGSSDNTSKTVLNTFHLNESKDIQFSLLSSERGRAKQMNLGAKHAKSEILYFLHADSFPPKQFDSYIISELQKGNNAGCFRMRFNSNHWWLKLAGWLTILPWKMSRGGDQSLFISKALFNDIGGYNEAFFIYEDNELISKLYALNSFVVIPKWLTTSARCYKKHGVWRTQYHFWNIHLKHKLGASPKVLTNYYIENLSNT